VEPLTAAKPLQKDSEARDVPVLLSLQPILRRWHAKTGGKGLLFTPYIPTRGGRGGKPPMFVQEHTMWRDLSAALKSCSLTRITWYEATKHTFASHWLWTGTPSRSSRQSWDTRTPR
jgi:hypothetical protein